MGAILSIFRNQIGIIQIAALFIALLVQPIAVFFHPYITPSVILLIGFSSLSLDLSKLIIECKNYVYHTYMLLVNLIILPIAMYLLIELLSYFVEPHVLHSFAIGSIVINAVCVAASAPAVVLVLKGNFERASLNMLLSSILMTITLPLVFVLLGIKVHMSSMQMFIYMSLIVIPPTIIGILIQKFLPRCLAYVSPYTSTVSVFLMVIITLGCPVGVGHLILDHWKHALVAISISMINFILLAFIGWFCAKPTIRERVTSWFLFYCTDIGLSIVFVHAWFKDDLMAILYVGLSVVTWCVMVYIAKLWLILVKWRGVTRKE